MATLYGYVIFSDTSRNDEHKTKDGDTKEFILRGKLEQMYIKPPPLKCYFENEEQTKRLSSY